MGRKQLLSLAIITFLIALSPFIVILIAISNSPFFDPAQSVNTCHSDEVTGKTNQEIADLLDFPLITLNEIPSDLPAEPRVFINFTDTDCQLHVLYRLYTQASLHLEIIVFEPDNRRTRNDWQCYEDPSADFETSCLGKFEYRGKYHGVMLRSPYSLEKTQNLIPNLRIAD